MGVSPTSSSFQPDLLDISGRQTKGWTNKLILSSLKSGALRRQIEDAGGLKLIYIKTRTSTSARTSPWTSRSAAKPSTRKSGT